MGEALVKVKLKPNVGEHYVKGASAKAGDVFDVTETQFAAFGDKFERVSPAKDSGEKSGELGDDDGAQKTKHIHFQPGTTSPVGENAQQGGALTDKQIEADKAANAAKK